MIEMAEGTEKTVSLYEVGPRDGLQNESHKISTAAKIALVDLLSSAGFSHIEVTSFVSSKWVPQMADAALVMEGIERRDKVRYAVLTPNMIGFEKAVQANADEVAVFAAASEAFSQKNINCSIAESIKRFRPIMDAASRLDIPVRGYISCVIACPYDGEIEPPKVQEVAENLLAMGCYEVSLGDTIGAGTPDSIAKLLELLRKTIPADKLAGHYHDTANQALANVERSLEFGLRRFDSAVGGLGGCPYAPGAKGNVASQPLAKRLAELGWQTGLDMDILARADSMIRKMGISEKGVKL